MKTDNTMPLWAPTAARWQGSVMAQFIAHIGIPELADPRDYQPLHQWSVTQPEVFWRHVWDFCGVVSSQAPAGVLQRGDTLQGAKWFPGARLNFAENLLRRRDRGVALVQYLESGERRVLHYDELFERVQKLAAALRREGIEPGDRVVGYLPNTIDAVIAMLATTSLGGIWSSCSPDFGFSGVMDRFGQIQPKVMFALDEYQYNGKRIDCRERVAQLADSIASLERVVLVPTFAQSSHVDDTNKGVALADYLSSAPAESLQFAQLPFDHPLYIMYSSGTTGAPKCIVHGAGGTLLQHLKEHQLHVGLTPQDVIFFFTTCGWMMWNWLVSALATGSTLVLYDGSPLVGEGRALLDIAERERVSVFGVGAKYLAAIEKNGLVPGQTHDLSALKTILSTGSPLSHESFHYVYRSIKSDVCLSSISGGTDIISCFLLGNECLPVYPGELQCPGLGMAVAVWSDEGTPLEAGKGELVCTEPFPSCPIGFWDDADGQRFHTAYFARFEGVWAHGDYGEWTAQGGMIIHGRSDAVLNPGGVRIGTAEIYRQVESIDAVLESCVIGQPWGDDVRVVLFVVLRPGAELTDSLSDLIRQTIRRNTTPRHVPAKIIAVPELPKTLSGKVVEIAVRHVVQGEPVKNKEALANPDALAYFANRPELLAD